MKRKRADQTPQPHNIWQGAILILIVLAVVVITLMFLAWAMPSATNTRRIMATTLNATEESTAALESTSGTEAIIPTDPEDVGYGDGIIIASGVLLLILLAATFREIVIYNKHNQAKLDEGSDLSEAEQQHE